MAKNDIAEEYFNIRASTRAFQNPYEAGGVGVGGLTQSVRRNRQQMGASYLTTPTDTHPGPHARSSHIGRAGGRGGGSGYISASEGPAPLIRELPTPSGGGRIGPTAYTQGAKPDYGFTDPITEPRPGSLIDRMFTAKDMAALGGVVGTAKERRADKKEAARQDALNARPEYGPAGPQHGPFEPKKGWDAPEPVLHGPPIGALPASTVDNRPVAGPPIPVGGGGQAFGATSALPPGRRTRLAVRGASIPTPDSSLADVKPYSGPEGSVRPTGGIPAPKASHPTLPMDLPPAIPLKEDDGPAPEPEYTPFVPPRSQGQFSAWPEWAKKERPFQQAAFKF
jgi:hypothetical protein